MYFTELRNKVGNEGGTPKFFKFADVIIVSALRSEL